MVFMALSDQEGCGHKQSQKLRRGNGQPDTINTEENRKYKYHTKLEDQSPQEGNNGGDQAVIQCREEGGAEDIETVDQEGHAEQTESGIGHLEQLLVVAHENPCQRGGDDLRKNGQRNTADTHQGEALAEKIL